MDFQRILAPDRAFWAVCDGHTQNAPTPVETAIRELSRVY